jgi:hypothetical protein
VPLFDKLDTCETELLDFQNYLSPTLQTQIAQNRLKSPRMMKPTIEHHVCIPLNVVFNTNKNE